MNLFGKTFIGTVFALVAGVAMLVYGNDPAPAAVTGSAANGGDSRPRLLAANEQVRPQSTAPLPMPEGEKAETGAAADNGPEPQFDVSSLPQRVQENLAQIIEAAQTGDLEAMRPVLESNGLKPMVRNGPSTDPIAYWKKRSVDGSGRDILADILNVFSSGFVKIERKDSVMYIWPYFAERDLTKLTPVEQVELFRIVPPKQAVKMMKAGKYTGHRAGISDRGILHYFKK
ncbi:hypothetical protein A7A08_02048 [Methyloligella halotolerans]|uniref:Uncharacterized protein n=1 Tax=Methyloligella halotolerans TaxID=1177755 RepID=A0A1E2RYK9_9HYPH|nr:hypothetical protein [Methyloligella halotolerans]ODA67301.1 hypothetical protein A7A08_02048 [Methyloligella halotolerans]